jgi:hypothetical protein
MRGKDGQQDDIRVVTKNYANLLKIIFGSPQGLG